MNNTQVNIQADVEAVSRIPAIATILEVVCRTTGMGFAAVARVTEDRWVACAVLDEIEFGLVPGSELKVETTICHEIQQHKEAVIIDYVADDEIYANHHTPELYGFQSYISMPIMLKNGSFFGTLCAIDPRPAELSKPEIIAMFKLFADLIAFHLNADELLTLTEKKLLEERKTAALREEFIAILGHDLRNPVTAVSNSAQLLQRMPLDDRGLRLANIIQDSCLRMTGLIDNVLDFAHGRMGGGITLTRNASERLEDILVQVVNELQLNWPDRAIEAQFRLTGTVNCDDRRIAQLFSNLLGNALTYGKADAPIRVEAISNGGEFMLSVANRGDKIPAAAMDRLFQPFSRGEVEPNKQGLGLGLYIASEIARAHDGTLDVISTQEETCFTLRLSAKQTGS